MSANKRMLMAIGAALVAVFATMATGCSLPTVAAPAPAPPAVGSL